MNRLILVIFVSVGWVMSGHHRGLAIGKLAEAFDGCGVAMLADLNAIVADYLLPGTNDLAKLGQTR